MQEKVQPTLHTIKIFEGKIPPNSWVSENIVLYLQTQSKESLLKDVLTYMQTLQSEQLANLRPKITQLKEAFLPLPEKATSQDVATITTFNTTQGMLKTQIESLLQLVNLLKEGDPKLSQQLDTFLGQLKQMTASFPNLTEQQLKNLTAMIKELTTLAQSTPLSFQRSFWNTQLKMLQAMMTHNKLNTKELQSEIKELQGRIKMLNNLDELLQNIKNALQAKPPTQQQLRDLIENLQSLANHSSQFNPQQQQAVINYFQQLNTFKGAKGQSLSQMTADSVVHAKLSEFLKTNPQATPPQVAAYLKSFLHESNLQSSSLPFMKSLGDSIDEVINKKGFPISNGLLDEPLATTQNGKIVPSATIIQEILSGYTPSTDSLNTLGKTASAINVAASNEISENEIKITGFTTAVNELKGINQHLGQAAAFGVGQSLVAGSPPPGMSAPGDSEPLPNQFAHAIIDHYMPQQEAYLRSLAMFLFLDNMGAQFGNTLLNHMLGFGEAADNFDFSNYLHSKGIGPDEIPNFSGSESQAKAQLSAEKAAAQNALGGVVKSQYDISKAIAQINARLAGPPTPTPSQKAILNSMKTKLQGIYNNLTTAYTQLTELFQNLNSIKIGPPNIKGSTPGSSFGVYGSGTGQGPPPAKWESKLGKAEGDVINGNPKEKYPGGLVSIQSSTQAFQQDYADQGQNQQMILQMKMTEIQQEWTIVSTALQLLNQMYMSLSQAIYKG